MGSTSNGGEKEEERPSETNSPNIGAVAVAIGTVAVAAWGVSRMFSDNNPAYKWSQVKDEMNGALKTLGLEPIFGASTSSSSAVPPQRGFKLTTHGACQLKHHDGDDRVWRALSGYAGILEDDRGKWVRGFQGFIDVSDYFTAAIHGILKGLELLDRFGYKESILENDYQAAVEWVIGQANDPGKSPIVRDCWELIKQSRQLVRKNRIIVRCCSRDANKDADKLAWLAIDKCNEYVEFTNVSCELNSQQSSL